LAVGTYDEISEVADAFPGDLLVLTPWRPWIEATLGDDRLVHTVSRLTDLKALATLDHRPRVVVEVLTSMRRHGITPDELTAAAGLLADVRFEGFALHLPLSGNHSEEVRSLGVRAIAAAEAAGSKVRTLWVSHLGRSAADAISDRISADIRLRMGTAVWLGDRAALSARARVLDVHPVGRGDRSGYRQRRAERSGTVVVVAGGTAHGIGMEAPTPATTLRQRAVAVAKGGLDAMGRALSPYRIAGRQRWFVEPPHMQCSMVWLPSGVPAPAVGDDVEVDVRFTTTTFDNIVWDT
jgi:alanine racemase